MVLAPVTRVLPLLFFALLLAGCMGPQMPEPVSAEPRFEPEQWFQGRTVGRGEFRRVIGGPPTRFSMTIDGDWNGRVLTMEETFITEDGRWTRVWTIRPLGGGRYEGRLTTGKGPARIRAEGDTVFMDYLAEAPLTERPFTARFNQALRLRPDGTVLNIADVRWRGAPLGRTTVVFSKPPAA